MPASKSADNHDSIYSFKNMPRPQRTAVVLLSVLGIAIVFFAALQLRNRIVTPFRFDGGNLASTTAAVSLTDRDTDGDGLSDYDELNIYHTSPYLEDSDSDGLPDNAEVKNGTDPNCPSGQDCFGTTNFAIQLATGTTAVIANSTSTTAAVNSGSLGTINISSTTSETDLKNTLAGQIDAPTLRQILLDNGADKAILDTITDADLLKSYQEVLNNQ